MGNDKTYVVGEVQDKFARLVVDATSEDAPITATAGEIGCLLAALSQAQKRHAMMCLVADLETDINALIDLLRTDSIRRANSVLEELIASMTAEPPASTSAQN